MKVHLILAFYLEAQGERKRNSSAFVEAATLSLSLLIKIMNMLLFFNNAREREDLSHQSAKKPLNA